MRLYLSSFRLGTAPEHLVRLAGAGVRVAVICNAVDAEPDDDRTAKTAAEIRALTRLGLEPSELDLRDYFGQGSDAISAALAAHDALWLRGGNVFVLRTALRLAGADDAIRDLLAADRLMYAGYSAGPCVLAPSLLGLETVDDITGPDTTYGVRAVIEGLGVLPYAVVPHYDAPTHAESAALGALAERYRADGVPHVRLRDGEALVIDGDTTTTVGRPADVTELLYENGPILARYLDPRTDSVVVTVVTAPGDAVAVLRAVAALGGSRGRPALEVERPDGSTLSIAQDDQRGSVVWVDPLGQSFHSVGDGHGHPFVYDYFGSWSEAPAGHTVALSAAEACLASFVADGRLSDAFLVEPE
ncbi:MAG: Imm1 family immunity protein [Candidatus Nanopelagicales bacterium]